MEHTDLYELSRDLRRQRRPHAWITVVAVQSPSSAYVGAQAIVEADGEMHGWIGGGCVQGAARSAALRSLASATPQRLRLSNSASASESVDVRPMACASGGEVELFIQPAAVAPRLRIYGNTPVARAAAWLARQIDFDPLTDAEAADAEALNVSLGSTREQTAAMLSERDSYALIATQGDGDEAALESALNSPAQAVLLVASKRKAERLRSVMAARGVPEERIAAMHAPAGPDIGAITPNEIALAAVAGLIALRHHRAGTDGATRDPAHAQSSQPSSQRTARTVPDATGYVNPVCGAVVDPSRALSTLSMRGQTHYFCCQGCRTEFERDPEKYLTIAAHMREPAREVSK